MATCRSSPRAATPHRRPPWTSWVRSPRRRTRPLSRGTSAPTRTSHLPHCIRWAVTETADEVQLNVPLNAAFGAPDLLRQLGLGTTLESLGERQYQNDEQMDNSLRSVLFQVPKPGIPDPAVCGEPVDHPECFKGVTDLGAIDIARGRDHGMPTYNDMRRAYGLAPKTSFTDITGEATQRFPSDPLIDAGDPINDPNILDFVRLLDDNG